VSDKKVTVSQESDPVVTYLAAVGERWSQVEYVGLKPEVVPESGPPPQWLADIPRLLRAVTEVLALADALIIPQPGDSPALAACGRKLRRIIAAELLKAKEAAGG